MVSTAWIVGACTQAPPEIESEAAALQQAGTSAQAASKRHHHGHGACAAACGNHVLEEGEACDDGNTQSGDGCDTTCQPDDNLATPGDDRPGYVLCTDRESGQTFGCGPGQGCCTQAGMHCAASSGECGTAAPFFDVCDGPEDCASSGRPCWAGRFGRICDRGTDGSGNACHTDADCIPNAPVCENGSCHHVQSASTQSMSSP
jgi:cysteine-rich repeat protein